ncbi:sigma-70 family RNA polymerase sigma factor [candidate division KSB1 bacterium]|nr:sigma-70 family RNA polymerase sigma factor [candidate division KSB1 bacterium]
MSAFNTDDVRLVNAYLSGDHKIEKQLFRDLRKLISKLIKAMVGKGIFFADEDDVVSEIVYQVMAADECKVLRAYRGQCKLSSYLWPIVRNKLIDAGRKEKRQHEKLVYQESYHTDIPEQPEAQGEIESIIQQYIEDQPPIEKFIKISKWMHGLSYAEIIESAGKKFSDDSVSLNYQRVAYILHSNRSALQKKLKKICFNFDT